MITNEQKRQIERIALKNLWNTQKTVFFTDLIGKVDEQTGNVILNAWID